LPGSATVFQQMQIWIGRNAVNLTKTLDPSHPQKFPAWAAAVVLIQVYVLVV
jgi:hypothetical protein